MQAERRPRRRRDRRARARRRRRSPSSGPARSATSSPASRTSARPARGETVTEAGAAGARRSRATATRSRWCSAGSTRSTATTSRTSARRSRSCGSTTRAITYEPETSGALGFGFRCGFLGLLHMEIVRERLEREFDLSLIATAPSVEYRVHTTTARSSRSTTRATMPPTSEIDLDRGAVPAGHHPHARPTYTGTVMDLCQTPAGRDAEARVPVARAGRARLPHPAGRGRHRLLRPAEEPHAGLRQPRLRAGRLPAARTW